MISLKNINYSIGKTEILKNINLSFKSGAFNIILGANGAGKSTLLKIAAGALKASSGEVFYNQKALKSISSRELAQTRAVLSQSVDIVFPLSLEEVVLMGRYPHNASAPKSIDRKIATAALEAVDLPHKRDQNFMTLSGGEKQKGHAARVLAQINFTEQSDKERVLFLDEPTSNLDIRVQLQILNLVQSLIPKNITIIAVLHDLNTAFEYGTHFFFMKAGELIAEIDNPYTINSKIISDVYGVKASPFSENAQNSPQWVFKLED